MTHTQKPWDARPSGYSITGRAGGPFYWNVYAKHILMGDIKIADMLNEDDARLIAAAPEMLEALKSAYTELVIADDILPQVIEQVEDAIARAEGA